MDKDSKIYVAGHTGLVGSAIVRRLHAEGFSNLVFRKHNDLDLRNQAAVEKFFEDEQPEYVFLSAAKVGGILANDTYKAEFIYDNIMISANVVSSAWKCGVKKLLNLGSSCIYPKLAPQPLKEEYLLTGSLESTNEPYAIAKIAAIKLCRYYNEQYGTNFVSVMPTNIYGSNDNYNLETSHVLPALIRKFHLAKLLRTNDESRLVADVKKYPIGFGMDQKIDKDNPTEIMRVLTELGVSAETVTLWGTGKPYREFLFVDDLADACVFVMKNVDHTDSGEFINVGTGEDQTIHDIAELVKRVVGFGGEIRFDSSKPDGIPRKLLNVGRLRKMGWTYKIGLEEGIARTYKVY